MGKFDKNKDEKKLAARKKLNELDEKYNKLQHEGQHYAYIYQSADRIIQEVFLKDMINYVQTPEEGKIIGNFLIKVQKKFLKKSTDNMDKLSDLSDERAALEKKLL